MNPEAAFAGVRDKLCLFYRRVELSGERFILLENEFTFPRTVILKGL